MTGGNKNALQYLRGSSAVIPDLFGHAQMEEFGAALSFSSSRTIHKALEAGSWPDLDQAVAAALSLEQCSIDWALPEEAEDCMAEALLTRVGAALLAHPRSFGLVSTEIPFDALATTTAAVRSGKRMVEMYAGFGVSWERVLFRVPASYEGLRAAAALTLAGLKAHVTHIYSLEQAALARDAGAFAGQVYIDRVNRAGQDGIRLAREVHKVFSAGAAGGRPGGTALIVASLSSLSDLSDVAGANYLLVPPHLLREMRDLGTDPLANSAGIASTTAAEDENAGRAFGFRILRQSKTDFEEHLPRPAAQLLAEGLEKYQRERDALRELVASSSQWL